MKDFFELAKKAGACKQRGLEVIARSKSVNDLIQLMRTPQGIEFCMENRFPQLDILQQYRDDLKAQQVYVDSSHSITGSAKILVFGGEVSITAEGFDVVEVFATNDSFINVKAKDNAFVSVELHHESRLTFERYGLAKVKEFRK